MPKCRRNRHKYRKNDNIYALVSLGTEFIEPHPILIQTVRSLY